MVAASILAVAIFSFFCAFEISSHLAQTSDSAQGFVVGHAVATGNALLFGWRFPIDNFYFSDSLPYAAAEAEALAQADRLGTRRVLFARLLMAEKTSLC
jgi:hypothetical protein